MKKFACAVGVTFVCLFYLVINLTHQSLPLDKPSGEAKLTKPEKIPDAKKGNPAYSQKEKIPSRLKVPPHECGSCTTCLPGENLTTQKISDKETNSYKLSIPEDIQKSRGAIGDTLFVEIGEREFTVELTTVAHMDRGYLYEGKIGDNGRFYLSSFDGIQTGSLVPDFKGDKAYYLDSREMAEVWQEKPIESVICNGPMTDNHAIVPVEYDAHTSGASPIPLHESNPGAIGVIYLDYDDHRLDSQGVPQPGPSPWNTIATTEQMTYVWEVVAEHFSYFDVNVTTDESIYLAAPPTQRVRCRFHKGSNGSSYLGAFANPSDGDMTNVGARFALFNPGRGDERTIADIIYLTIHELGHALGLSHDGPGYYTGHGEAKNHWAPTMGNGYNKRFWQWSKGDYQGGNNLEDDLQVIQNVGSFTYKPDDHANTLDSSATPIENTTLQEWDGLIEKEGDIDVFKLDVTSAGIAEIDVCTKVLGALNVDIDLVDASNVSQSSTVDLLPAESRNDKRRCYLTPGTYYLVIKATGTQYYSTYATLGSYKVDYQFTAGVHTEYTLTANPGANGSIDLNDSPVVFSGDSRTVKVVADNGYKISSLKIDGVNQQLSEDERNIGYSYTFTNVSSNHTIDATFAAASDGSEFLYSLFSSDNVGIDDTAAYGVFSRKISPVNLDGSSVEKFGYITYTESFEPGEISFYYKVSSHDGTFKFTVNGQSVLEQIGYSDWQKFTYTHNGGNQVLRWEMTRRDMGWPWAEQGEAAWVDEISLPPFAGNRNPLAENDSYSLLTSENTQLSAPFSVLKNDIDLNGDSLSAVLVSSTSNGNLSFNTDGTFTYTPNPGFSGIDTFTYSANDGSLSSPAATVEINVLSSSVSRGVLKHDVWFDSGGNYLSTLLADPRYPDNPDTSAEISSLDFPMHMGNNYGARGHGYLVPPVSGPYRFWITGDHEAQLWLSSDSKEINKVKIAEATRIASYDWDVTSSQQSSLIMLEAGQAYFIEALLKEGGGADHLAVAWEGPGIARAVISGQYMAAQTSNPPVTYALTVNSGSGSGSYAAGTVVNISASSAPSGQEFDVWAGDVSGVADVNSASTTFTVPSSVSTLTATYKNLPPVTYALTVNSGSGSGSYAAGTVVNISASSAPSGQEFDVWVGDVSGVADVSSASTTFTVPSSASTLTATYKALPPVTYALTVNSGSGSGSYVAGTVVNIMASSAPSGQEFDVWVGDVSGVADVSSASTTFTVPSSASTLTATYKPSGGVVTGALNLDTWFGIGGDHIDGLLNHPDYPNNPSVSGELTSFDLPQNISNNYGSRAYGYLVPPTTGSYTFWLSGDRWNRLYLSTDSSEQNKVHIAESKTPTGYQAWDSYASQKSVSINLVAGQAYFIEAILKEGGGGDHMSVAWEGPGFTRTVIAGQYLAKELGGAPPVTYSLTVNSGSGSGSYAAGTVVDIVASSAPSGQEFDTWVGDVSGVADVTSASTTFTVPSSVSTLTATYRDLPPVTYALTVNSGSGSGSYAAGTVVNISASSAPSGQEFDVWAGDVSGVADVTSASTTFTVPSSASTLTATYKSIGGIVTGALNLDTWFGIGGDHIDALLNHPDYPNNPSVSGELTSFDLPQNISNNYGSRAYGYLVPPTTGSYTFWLSGDRWNRLYLSTDSSEQNKVHIAESVRPTGYQAWDSYASQKSVSINLVAGQAYFIEAILKEGGGGDHMSVAWEGPGFTRTVITGQYLAKTLAVPVISGPSNDQQVYNNTEESAFSGSITSEELLFRQSVSELETMISSSQDIYVLLTDGTTVSIIVDDEVWDAEYDTENEKLFVHPDNLEDPLLLQLLIVRELLVESSEFYVIGVVTP